MKELIENGSLIAIKGSVGVKYCLVVGEHYLGKEYFGLLKHLDEERIEAIYAPREQPWNIDGYFYPSARELLWERKRVYSVEEIRDMTREQLNALSGRLIRVGDRSEV